MGASAAADCPSSSSQVGESPERELLAEKFRLLVRKLLVYLPERWWEIEGRQQKIEMAEVAGANVLVLPPLVIRVCQQIHRSTALEIPETPTIRGLIAGRDEILDEAIRFLQKKGSE